MKLFSFTQIPARLEQRGKSEPVRYQTTNKHFLVEKNGLRRQIRIGVTSNNRITSKSGGIGDLREDQAGVIEASWVLKSAKGNNVAGGECVEEKAGSKHLGVDLLEVGHVGAFF